MRITKDYIILHGNDGTLFDTDKMRWYLNPRYFQNYLPGDKITLTMTACCFVSELAGASTQNNVAILCNISGVQNVVSTNDTHMLGFVEGISENVGGTDYLSGSAIRGHLELELSDRFYQIEAWMDLAGIMLPINADSENFILVLEVRYHE